MATLSFADLKDTALPSLWDADEIRKVELADGNSFEDVVGDIRTGLQVLNGQLLSMQNYGDLFAVQDDLDVEYPVGVSNGVQEATEYGTPDPQRGATTGHMLPLTPWDRGLGWTMMYIRKARARKLDADIRSAMTDLRSHFQKQMLERFFGSGTESVGSGTSVPFADGGAADSDYVPLDSPDGESFTSSHDHFLRHATHDVASSISPAIETLQEHGHDAPYVLIGARADAGTYSALSEFKSPEWADIIFRATEDRAAFDTIERFFGLIETDYGPVMTWLTPRVPSGYYGVYSPYGAGDPRNPLRMRIDENIGFGWNLVPGNWVNAPQLMAVLYTEFGVGVGEDRTNGVAVEIDASGDYADPTIS